MRKIHMESLRPTPAHQLPSWLQSHNHQTRVPSGPAVILVATVLYIVSVLFGRVGGIVRQMFPGRHLEA